jgi:hypothetical protein
MTVPAQVRAQREKAQQLQEELGKPTPPEADPNNPNPAENQPAPAAAEPAAPTPEPQAMDWEQRYRTLQGMFNAQVPKLQAELRTANQQVAELRQALEQRTAAPKAPSSPLLTDKDVEDFGQDTIDVMRRAARQEATEQFSGIIENLQKQIATLQTTVVPKVAQFEQAATVSREEKFMRDLDTLSPTWRQLNNDPAFLDWLDEVDPFTGTIRQKLLDTAVQAADAHRAATFFTAFAAAKPAVVPTPTPQPGVSPELEALVTPGKGRGGAPQPEKPQITRAYIDAFYKDVAAGKYRSRPDEKSKIELDIFAAQREGRVAPN